MGKSIYTSPTFQFYVQRFLSGVRHFSAEETGAYILLLCEQWDNGWIDISDKFLKKITGISSKKLQKVIEKFEIGADGYYRNMVMETEREKQHQRSIINRKNVEGRWGKDRYNSNTNAIQSNKFGTDSEDTLYLNTITNNNSSLKADNEIFMAEKKWKVIFEKFKKDVEATEWWADCQKNCKATEQELLAFAETFFFEQCTADKSWLHDGDMKKHFIDSFKYNKNKIKNNETNTRKPRNQRHEPRDSSQPVVGKPLWKKQ